jgi:hypothetical protein
MFKRSAIQANGMVGLERIRPASHNKLPQVIE